MHRPTGITRTSRLDCTSRLHSLTYRNCVCNYGLFESVRSIDRPDCLFRFKRRNADSLEPRAGCLFLYLVYLIDMTRWGYQHLKPGLRLQDITHKHWTFNGSLASLVTQTTHVTLCPLTHRMTRRCSSGPPSKHYLERSMLNFRDRSGDG